MLYPLISPIRIPRQFYMTENTIRCSHPILLCAVLLLYLAASCQAGAGESPGLLYYSVQGRQLSSLLTDSETNIIKQHPALSGAWQRLRPGERLYFVFTYSPQSQTTEQDTPVFRLPIKQNSFLARIYACFGLKTTETIHGLWQPLITRSSLDFSQGTFRLMDSDTEQSLSGSGQLFYLVELRSPLEANRHRTEKKSPGGMLLPGAPGQRQPGLLLSGGTGADGPEDHNRKPGKGGLMLDELIVRISLQLFSPANYFGLTLKSGQTEPLIPFPTGFDLVLQTVNQWGEVLSEQTLSEDNPELYQWYLDRLGQEQSPLRHERLLVTIDKGDDREQPLTSWLLEPRLQIPQTLCGNHGIPGMITFRFKQPRGGPAYSQPSGSSSSQAGRPGTSTLSGHIASSKPGGPGSGGGGDDWEAGSTIWCTECEDWIPQAQWAQHQDKHHRMTPSHSSHTVYQPNEPTQVKPREQFNLQTLKTALRELRSQTVSVSTIDQSGRAPSEDMQAEFAAEALDRASAELVHLFTPVLEEYLQDGQITWSGLFEYFAPYFDNENNKAFQYLAIKWMTQVNQARDTGTLFSNLLALLTHFSIYSTEPQSDDYPLTNPLSSKAGILETFALVLISLEQQGSGNNKFSVAYSQLAEHYPTALSGHDSLLQRLIAVPKFTLNQDWISQIYQNFNPLSGFLRTTPLPTANEEWLEDFLVTLIRLGLVQYGDSIEEAAANVKNIVNRALKATEKRERWSFGEMSRTLTLLGFTPVQQAAGLMASADQSEPGRACLEAFSKHRPFHYELWMRETASEAVILNQEGKTNHLQAYLSALNQLFITRIDGGAARLQKSGQATGSGATGGGQPINPNGIPMSFTSGEGVHPGMPTVIPASIERLPLPPVEMPVPKKTFADRLYDLLQKEMDNIVQSGRTNYQAIVRKLFSWRLISAQTRDHAYDSSTGQNGAQRLEAVVDAVLESLKNAEDSEALNIGKHFHDALYNVVPYAHKGFKTGWETLKAEYPSAEVTVTGLNGATSQAPVDTVSLGFQSGTGIGYELYQLLRAQVSEIKIKPADLSRRLLSVGAITEKTYTAVNDRWAGSELDRMVILFNDLKQQAKTEPDDRLLLIGNNLTKKLQEWMFSGHPFIIGWQDIVSRYQGAYSDSNSNGEYLQKLKVRLRGDEVEALSRMWSNSYHIPFLNALASSEYFYLTDYDRDRITDMSTRDTNLERAGQLIDFVISRLQFKKTIAEMNAYFQTFRDIAYKYSHSDAFR